MERPAVVVGYSGTPLAKKLGIAPGSHVLRINTPAEYERLLDPIPEEVVFTDSLSRRVDIAHLFVTEKNVLVRHLRELRKGLRPEAAVWISWPKKTSKVPSTVTEDTIREAALPIGYVDIKVCAVSEVWSGLRLVVRKELR